MSEAKKIALFGAGQIGRAALDYFGVQNVRCFVDNNAQLAGSQIHDVPVITFEQLKEIHRDVQIVISMDVYKTLVVAAQLKEAGIQDYKIYLKMLEASQTTSVPTAVSSIHKTECSEKKSGKHVLMVTYAFPPLSGSGVFRSLKFAKYLPQFGWTPTVVAADRPRLDWNYADQSLMEEIPEGMNVIRLTDPVGTMQETSLAEKQHQLLPFLQEALEGNPEAESIFSDFLKTETGCMEMLTFPCAALLWSYNVVRYVEENLNVGQIAAVYTSSDPYSAHLAGAYLKKKYHIPWVADYRDPWSKSPVLDTIPNLDTPRGKLFCCLEAILFRTADCNIVVEEELAQSYAESFGLSSEKVVCITNGYDEADFEGLSLSEERTDCFTINYSGILQTGRSVTAILEALQQLEKEKKIDLAHIKLRFVGAVRQYDPEVIAKQFGLESTVIRVGYVSHLQALQYDLDSNLLLLFAEGEEARHRSIYTGKIFEYLRIGRPILAIGPKNGAIDRTLQETGHGEAYLSTQIPKIKTVILREYNRWKSGQQALMLHSPKIEQFERKALTKQLAEILNKLAINGSAGGGVEFPNSVYNEGYKSGGAGGGYHKHYTQCGYYLFWQTAMSYLERLDSSSSILEIGCGVGQFANMLFDHGFTNYMGFDFAEEAVKRAKQTNMALEDRFVVADAFETELLDKDYNLVICFEVLEHLNKDLELLERIHTGTKLLLSVPNFDDLYHVRSFKNETEVLARYEKVMKIEEIKKSMLSLDHWLYYIWGEKL